MVRMRSLLLAGAGLCLASSFTIAEPAKLRLGVIAASMQLFQSVPLFIAQERGLYKEQDLLVDYVPLPGVDHMITALDRKTVDISSTATPYLVTGNLRGSDAVAIVGGPANTLYSIVTKAAITDVAQLRGKTVGLSLPQDMITVTAKKILAKHNLADGDYVGKQLIGSPLRTKCLETGECDAAPVSPPEDILLARKGFHIVANSREVIPSMQFTVFAASRSWAAEHRDETVRFARAIGAAYKFMAAPSNRDAVIKIAHERTGIPEDVAQETYDVFYKKAVGVMPKQGEIDMDGMSAMIALMGEAGFLKEPLPEASKFVDLEFLKAAGLQ